jgi:hypothetical protein
LRGTLAYPFFFARRIKTRTIKATRDEWGREIAIYRKKKRLLIELRSLESRALLLIYGVVFETHTQRG